jgi:MFS family permease
LLRKTNKQSDYGFLLKNSRRLINVAFPAKANKMIETHDNKLFERNITLNYIISSVSWGRFFIPILALFYIASKVSLEQFTIIMAVFSLATLVFEIPTGVIADLLGKKNTLLLSRAMYIIEIFLIAFFNGFWIFLVAKIISGIGVSLSSGTNQAIVYDSLKKIKRENEHKKISGIANTVSKISMSFVFIIGAYLFTLNPKLPAYVSLPFMVLAFVLTFFMTEPYKPEKKFTMKNSLEHLKQGLTYFKGNYYLKYLAMLTLLVGATISMMLSLSSKYFELILIPITLIGVVSFVTTLISAYTAKKASYFEEKIGEKNSMYIILVLTCISIFLMSFMLPYLGLLFFAFIPFVQGFYEVIIGDYVNRHIDTAHRATMLSINNMFDNIGIFVLFPIIGILNKQYSMQISLLAFSIFIFVFCIFLIVFYRNAAHGKPT